MKDLPPIPSRAPKPSEDREGLSPTTRDLLARALAAGRAGRVGPAIRCLGDAIRRSRREPERAFLAEVDHALREAVAWRAHLAAAVAHLEPRGVLLPSREAAPVEAEVVSVDVRGLAARILCGEVVVDGFLPYEDLPLPLLRRFSQGLADPESQETHRNIGVLRWFRGDLDGARRSFDEARRLAPRVDLSVEERLLAFAREEAKTPEPALEVRAAAGASA